MVEGNEANKTIGNSREFVLLDDKNNGIAVENERC